MQGPTGSGQGGWSAFQLANAVSEPVSIALRRPVPLGVDLEIVADEASEQWRMVNPNGDETIMIAEPATTNFAVTDPVTVADAHVARQRTPATSENHGAPNCFSCGLHHPSMKVHPGDLGDGRFATDFRIPDWVSADYALEGLQWAALDCVAAMYVSYSGEPRDMFFTVQIAVQIHEPIQRGAEYSVVGWQGSYQPDWDGRKRGAASAMFDADGNCIGQADTFWLAV